jgi:hypothetical protein
MALTFNWVAEEFSIAGEQKVTVIAEGREIDVRLDELYELWTEVNS